MAPKRPSPLEDPPSASSSDDEEVAADEEVEEEEAAAEEEEEEEAAAEEEEATEEEEEEAVEKEEEEEEVEEEEEEAAEKEEEEVEEEEEDEVADEETLKSSALPMASSQPIVKKPAVEDVQNVHKKASKPVEDVEMKKTNLKSAKVLYMKSIPKAGAKREVEAKEVVVVAVPAAVAKNGKKQKKSETVVSEKKQQLEDSKKQGQRLFSEESEIELLKGMVDFADKTGKDFKEDQDGFYAHVKKELDVAFSKSQLLTKVKNLKRKYTKNVEKVKNGEELKPLDKKMYELSSKIWGGGGAVKSVRNGGIDVASKSNGKRKRVKKEHIFQNEEEMCDATTEEAEVDSLSLMELMKSSAGYVLNEELIKRGWNLISKDKRMKMNEQWESLLLDEVKLNLRRLELARLHGQLVLDAFGALSH